MSSDEVVTKTQDGIHLYKALIDQLAETGKANIIAQRIREHGHSERTNSDALAHDPLEAERVLHFARMDPQQREMVAGLIEQVRLGAVHDVAALIDWLTTSQELEIRWRGVVVPESPFGSYHYDFMSRMNGDIWPDEVNKQG